MDQRPADFIKAVNDRFIRSFSCDYMPSGNLKSLEDYMKTIWPGNFYLESVYNHETKEYSIKILFDDPVEEVWWWLKNG